MWAREGAGNQQYSEWIADASYNAYLLNGDDIFIKSQLEGLVNNFRGWEDRFEPALNLYFISPHGKNIYIPLDAKKIKINVEFPISRRCNGALCIF